MYAYTLGGSWDSSNLQKGAFTHTTQMVERYIEARRDASSRLNDVGKPRDVNKRSQILAW